LASERSKIGIESKDILITRDRHRDLTERKAKERKEEGRKEGKKEGRKEKRKKREVFLYLFTPLGVIRSQLIAQSEMPRTPLHSLTPPLHSTTPLLIVLY
jgi:hypothetical protein